MQKISERIKIIRGMDNQAEFSAKIGISQRTLSRYEQGENTPDADCLKAICEVTGTSISWLLWGTDTTPISSDTQERITELEEKLKETQAKLVTAQETINAGKEEMLEAYRIAVQHLKPAPEEKATTVDETPFTANLRSNPLHYEGGIQEDTRCYTKDPEKPKAAKKK